MSVPLLNLKLQNESLSNEINEAILRVVSSQNFILGPDVSLFEEEIANYLDTKYAVAVSSGTDALLMALMALGIGEGDEVITSPYSFFATAGSIARLGATPVFIDIDPRSFNINPSLIESKITKKTKAIMPVHLFGQSADMDQIRVIANKYNIPIIEDAAQSIGSKFSNTKVGGLGSMACFSFFPSKTLGGFGDSGLVTTNDESLFDKLISIRSHGQKKDERYNHQLIGGNFRIDTIQAAILSVKLKKLDNWIDARRRNAQRYKELFIDALPKSAIEESEIFFPGETKNAFHTYNQYVLRVGFRDMLLNAAKKAEIGMMVYYPKSLHMQPCFSYLNYKEEDFIESMKASKESIALPIYPELPKEDQEQVVDFIVKQGKIAEKW